jgi:hydroxyethylthiazole kinase
MHQPQAASRNSLAQEASAVLTQLRARAPRVHCITNNVAQNFTANALLAAGAVPSMTLSTGEVGQFVAGAQSLLVNLGTFDAGRQEATLIAVDTARRNRLPWVLDPVFVDRAPPRAAFARELVGCKPGVVRLNHAEFQTLSGSAPTREAVTSYARASATVVALSGEVDLVTDGKRVAAITNGHVLMAKVTAMGCAGSALLAACLAVESDPFRAAVSALAIMGVAGEQAGAEASGPGSFAVAILDALHELDAQVLALEARID